ncbi:MAG: 23S rRNA (uracil(1939)-C(5))-methyltransferase RlmD [Simkaniaceae bacterium]|nr:23S rRNA (uracil(1939)-C(5))-methyltransferase RlmD [Simkaniaceae bacterium]
MKNDITLEIQKINAKGHGIGISQSGVKVEVMTTVVGDVVRTKPLKKRKGIYLSLLQEIIKPSQDRVQPKCSHVGICGGCSLQQLKYIAQLEHKSNLVKELFPNAKAEPIIPCSSPFSYRNKMEFSFSENKEGEKFLGLMIARSRGRVLNLTECYLSPDWFIDTLKRVKSWWDCSSLNAYHHYSNSGALRNLTLREGMRTKDRMIILTVSGHPDFALTKRDLEGFKNSLELGENVSVFLKIHQIQKGKPTQFFELNLHGPDHYTEKLQLGSKEFIYKISPSAFFQPNTAQAEKLYQAALSIPLLTKDSIVFDLYSGIASLGMTFAPHVKQVYSVELNPYAVYDALLNMEINKIKNMEMRQGDVGKILKEIPATPDLVVIDPPRSGLEEIAINHLLQINPPQILYVSCNPKTQARDIHVFMQHGYVIKKVQPVDQFPHTPHLENIVLLGSAMTL